MCGWIFCCSASFKWNIKKLLFGQSTSALGSYTQNNSCPEEMKHIRMRHCNQCNSVPVIADLLHTLQLYALAAKSTLQQKAEYLIKKLYLFPDELLLHFLILARLLS